MPLISEPSKSKLSSGQLKDVFTRPELGLEEQVWRMKRLRIAEEMIIFTRFSYKDYL